MQHAHELPGLVHRDIKPGNILVDRNGIVKILDMGLARFFHDEDDMLTKKYDENVLGTADYLAPEQALDSHSVDIRADIYSLGATFYFCLTGQTPFAEGSVAQKLIWHQTRQPKPIRTLRPEVPAELAGIIEKMMAKDPAQRYQAPYEVAEALTLLVQTPIGPPPQEEMPQPEPRRPRRRWAQFGSSGCASDSASSRRKSWQVPPTPSPAPRSSFKPSRGGAETAVTSACRVRQGRSVSPALLHAPPNPRCHPPGRPAPMDDLPCRQSPR